MSIPTNVFILGDGGAGKTALVSCLRGTPFPRSYLPTMGAEIHPYVIGDDKFRLFDFAGQEKFAAAPTVANMPDCHLALILYSGTSRIMQRNISRWAELVPGVPMKVIRTMSDCTPQKDPNEDHLHISCRTGSNMPALVQFLSNFVQNDEIANN